ncbi:uroporphyrinogen-III C-methyltransferase [Marimonas arenosa]|uniref:uroporphyrinogen-III C-methyltransferase n=1 Tax=Marimonas arenosa TaxID=1795305 RepID=A0AAE4B7Q2_9RHOB|nr:uroporphyrinogen-III C-methyltransferase [Marimonas arenosa]MDQ2091776.1 uroporphyrinogen-III C-methyltransferase [Marimonas arenosa]
MKDSSLGKVFLIGAGPGDPDLLTVKALRLLRAADVVVFDRLVSPEIMALIPDGTRLINAGKAAGNHTLPQDRINALLAKLATQGLRVVRLKGGDPLIFGRGSEEAAELAGAGIPFEYVPGITSAQGAAASTGVPLTHRGLAAGVRYVTGHRASDARLDLDWQSLADPDTTLVVYMGTANIAEIAFELMRQKLPSQTPVMAVSAATTPREKRIVSTLGGIAAEVAATSPAAPVLFIIGRVVSLCDAAQPAKAVRYA